MHLRMLLRIFRTIFSRTLYINKRASKALSDFTGLKSLETTMTHQHFTVVGTNYSRKTGPSDAPEVGVVGPITVSPRLPSSKIPSLVISSVGQNQGWIERLNEGAKSTNICRPRSGCLTTASVAYHHVSVAYPPPPPSYDSPTSCI